MDAVMLALIGVAVLVVTWYRWSWRRYYELAAAMSGPPALPLIGNALLFLGHSDATFARLLALHKAYGPAYALWLGPRLYAMVSDPGDVEVVLGNPRLRNRDKMMSWVIERVFGVSILTSAGEMWKKRRKLITPLFHFRILETYVEVFARKTSLLLKALDKHTDDDVFDVYEHLSMSTLDSICETAIGINMDTQVTTEEEFGAAISQGMELVHDRVLRPWLLITWLHAMSENARQLACTVKTLRAFTERIISKKFSEHHSGKPRCDYPLTSSAKPIIPFSDMLISAAGVQELLTEAEIRDEVTTVAASGLETTATTMSCALVLVAMHPDVQAKINEELAQVFGSDDRLATMEDISQLQYLKCVLKETLRMFPAVTLLPREINEEVTLASGATLPAGCTAVVISYITHRYPEHWPDAESFLPDRWSVDNSVRHPYAYIPFSAGPRNCVGQKYAMLQMSAMLSSVFRRYHVTTDTKLSAMKQIRISMTSRPVIGYNIRLRRR